MKPNMEQIKYLEDYWEIIEEDIIVEANIRAEEDLRAEKYHISIMQAQALNSPVMIFHVKPR
ncbi:hypothetical protein [Methanosarcina horonobensis]|uniref:hypothetical protein n=1 Tax=Methanosarcina horonobensis TaxID=418008 RepID=UPI000A9B7363|nr:hypothetical protein [Methanosarcina horonobensis]